MKQQDSLKKPQSAKRPPGSKRRPGANPQGNKPANGRARVRPVPPPPRRSRRTPPLSRTRQLARLHRGVAAVPPLLMLVLMVVTVVVLVSEPTSALFGYLMLATVAAAALWIAAIALRVRNAAARRTRQAERRTRRLVNRRSQRMRRTMTKQVRRLDTDQKAALVELEGRMEGVTASQSKLSTQLEQEQRVTRKTQGDLSAQVQRVQDTAAMVARVEQRVDELAPAVAELREAQAEIRGEVQRAGEEASRRLSGVEQRVDELAPGVAELREVQAKVRGEVREAGEEVTAAVSRVEQRVDQLAPAVEELGEVHRNVSASLEERLHELAQRVETLSAAISEQRAEAMPVAEERLLPPPPVPQRSHVFNAGYYQPFRRHLRNSDLDRLTDHWTVQLGCRLTRAEIGYLAHRVGVVEQDCRGRLAKSVESSVLMMMAGRAALQNAAAGGRPLRVLEIGTLFGVGLGLIYEACRDRHVDIELHVIDPLDGYYASGVPDMITGVPVTRAAWEENLLRMGVPADSWHLYETLSSEALPRLRDEKFDLIVIDGDHTYDAVKLDGESCIDLLEVGGYLLFDDYGNQHWPDVQRYVDEHVLYRPGLQKVGDDFATAIFRSF